MKIIGMFYVDLGFPEIGKAAHLTIASIKEAMPDSSIVQFTNMLTPALPHVDEVVRRPPDDLGLMEGRMEHYSTYPHKQMLFIDPDIIIQKDVWDVFDDEFDVAMADRGGKPVMLNGKDISKVMPHNLGVAFSTGTQFWRRCLVEMKKLSLDDRNWFGDQIAVGRVARSKIFKIKTLDMYKYNYSPQTKDEDVSSRFIVHYKGKRKSWMPDKSKSLA